MQAPVHSIRGSSHGSKYRVLPPGISQAASSPAPVVQPGVRTGSRRGRARHAGTNGNATSTHGMDEPTTRSARIHHSSLEGPNSSTGTSVTSATTIHAVPPPATTDSTTPLHLLQCLWCPGTGAPFHIYHCCHGCPTASAPFHIHHCCHGWPTESASVHTNHESYRASTNCA